jgi:hypothetical protein
LQATAATTRFPLGLHTDNNNNCERRFASALLYLNETKDGHTVFPLGGTADSWRGRVPRGDVISASERLLGNHVYATLSLPLVLLVAERLHLDLVVQHVLCALFYLCSLTKCFLVLVLVLQNASVCCGAAPPS